MKTADKLEIVSTFLSKLTDITSYMSPNELVLAANLDEQSQPIQSQTLITFPNVERF